MTNRELYVRDPLAFRLLNNGVAKVVELASPEEEKTLRHELETFVCEGQYEKGLERILRAYLDNLDSPEQPAVWISGFFGSGKSHLVKMLRYLWVNYTFSDGATARGLTNLPQGVSDLFAELATAGKRYGGLHAVSGTLRAGASDSVRLALLGLVFKSVGLPESYPLARFLIWLKQEGKLDAFRAAVEAKGKTFQDELRHLYVSPVIAESLRKVMPEFSSISEVRTVLRNQFPDVRDVSLEDMVRAMHDALARDGVFPCTLIVLDEIQQYIGDSADRAYDIQEVIEKCVSRFKGKLMIVGTGQNALTDTQQLSRLIGRFKIRIQLSDADVEAVTRKTVLAKKPSAQPQLKQVLESCSGEISRHLVGTHFAPRPEDKDALIPDYPLLPTRRRFWEKTLRVVDSTGTAGQLRSQLQVVDDAVKSTAELPLGHVVGADFVYEQKRNELLQSGMLPLELDTQIERFRERGPDGALDARICALVFLIGKMPRESSVDTGLRATADTLADLLVTDLPGGSSALRQQVAHRLEHLAANGPLMKVGNEYRIQTRQSAEWEGHFLAEYRKLMADPQRRAADLEDALRLAVTERLKDIGKLLHGDAKVPRSLRLQFGGAKPSSEGPGVPVWVRNGWQEPERTILADARQEGTDSPLVFVYLPQRSADDLEKALAEYKAATITLQVKGRPTETEGIEARRAIETRQQAAEAARDTALQEIMQGAKVFLAGGQEIAETSLEAAVREAAEAALLRLYPRFDEADDSRWGNVVKRARTGDGNALHLLGHQGSVEQHPVCAAVLKEVGAGKKGSEVRARFEQPPYGWPRDAVDAALYLLAHNALVRVTLNGQPVDVLKLDQRQIAKAEFRAEQVTLTATQRIKLRQLFQNAGMSIKSGEEASAAGSFLAHLREMAARAGGPAPLPEIPNPPLLTELESLNGNEQLLRLYEERNTLNEWMSAWGSAENLRKTRLPRWEQLRQLLRHGQGLEALAGVREQADAILAQRSLLDKPDPVKPLLDQAAQMLREALSAARDRYRQRFDAERQALEASTTWQQLDPDQRQDLLAQFRIDEVPAIDVSDTEALLRSLNDCSLEDWRTRLDALPTRFTRALTEAARLLMPKAVRVTLPPATLRTEADVDAWLSDARRRLLDGLAKGPVIV
ncbi:BREX system P-loop protein BrxC [Rhodocaloribacter sp.]